MQPTTKTTADQWFILVVDCSSTRSKGLLTLRDLLNLSSYLSKPCCAIFLTMQIKSVYYTFTKITVLVMCPHICERQHQV